jgi:hypothetical protein
MNAHRQITPIVQIRPMMTATSVVFMSEPLEAKTAVQVARDGAPISSNGPAPAIARERARGRQTHPEAPRPWPTGRR